MKLFIFATIIEMRCKCWLRLMSVILKIFTGEVRRTIKGIGISRMLSVDIRSHKAADSGWVQGRLIPVPFAEF